MSSGNAESFGDNKEFAMAAIEDVTIYFVPDVAGRTSANDTATSKYFDAPGCVKRFVLRCDQVVQIISMTETTFTDPITVLVNTAGKTTGIHTEEYDVPILTKMVVRPTVAGTNIKIRTHTR